MPDRSTFSQLQPRYKRKQSMKKDAVRKEFCTCNLQDIINRAEAEARMCGSHRIEISHLLIALLLCEGSHAGAILSELGVKPFLVIEDLRKHLKGNGKQKKTTGNLHFSYQSAHVFDFAKDEAIKEGKGYMYSHHLLFAIIHGSRGNAAKTLAAHGLSESTIRAKYKELLSISKESPDSQPCAC